LAELGVRIAIDDFGTGYSSLAYLKDLPVNQLKIDQSFVQHMHEDLDDAIIVRSVVDLGHNLGLQTVAEGVEDHATWDQLAQLGCDDAQGYFLAKPMPPNEFLSWLESSGRPVTTTANAATA
jgi:EAL domain-containing protein (putative c-di-GMP-specific phosphodiesterase class I)